MKLRAEIIIWQPTTELQLQTMYCVYDNGTISRITQTKTDTVVAYVESWHMIEHVQFAMFAGFELRFNAIRPDYRTGAWALYQRSKPIPATC